MTFPAGFALERMEDHSSKSLKHESQPQPDAKLPDAGCRAEHVIMYLAHKNMHVHVIDTMSNHANQLKHGLSMSLHEI